MAEQTIDKLQVEVEASARGTSSVFKQLESQLTILKKAFEAIDTSKLSKIQKAVNAANPKINTSGMSKAEREIDASIKKIQESMAGLKTYAEKSMGGDKSAFSTYDKQATSLQSTMDKLTEKIRQMGNTSVQTKAFKDVDNQIENARERLASLQKTFDEARSGKLDMSDNQFKNLGDSIIEAQTEIDRLIEKQREMENAGTAYTDPIDKYRESLDQLQAKLTDTTTQIQTAIADISNAQPAGTPLDALVEKLQGELPTAISKIQQDFAGLGSYAEAALGGDKSAFTSFERRVTSIQSAIDVVTNKLQQLEGAGVSGEGLESYRAALQAVQEQLGATSNAVQAAYAQMNNVPAPEVSKEADKASSSMHRLASSRTGLEGLSKALSKIKDHLKGISVHGPNMGKVFKNILKYGFGIRSLYVGFRRLRKAVIESFGELQNSGAFFQTTRANIEALKTSLLTLKFQFGAAFEPIFNAVAPAIKTFIDNLVNAMNALSAFMARLTGKSTYSKVKWVNTATGEAAKNAKELNKQLQKFDELNNLTTNQGGSGSGSEDETKAVYEEASVESALGEFGKKLADLMRAGEWNDVGKTISDKLSEQLESIDWESIKGKAGKFGRNLAEFLNGLIDPRLFGDIGHTIGEAINTGLTFFNEWGKGMNWENVGSSLATGFNEWLKAGNLPLLGETLHTWIAGGLDALNTFLEEADFEELGKQLAEFIGNLNIPDLAKKLLTLAKNILKALAEALGTAFKEGDISTKIVLAIGVGLGALSFVGKLAGLARKIGTALGLVGASKWGLGGAANTIAGGLGAQLSTKTISIPALALTIGKILLLVKEYQLVGGFVANKLSSSASELGFSELAEEYKKFAEHPILYTGEAIADIFSFIKEDGFGKFAKVVSETFSPSGEFVQTVKGLFEDTELVYKGFNQNVDELKNKFGGLKKHIQDADKEQSKFFNNTTTQSATSGRTLETNYNKSLSNIERKFGTAYEQSTSKWSGLGSWASTTFSKITTESSAKLNQVPSIWSQSFTQATNQGKTPISQFQSWLKGLNFEKKASIKTDETSFNSAKRSYDSLINTMKNKTVTISVKAEGFSAIGSQIQSLSNKLSSLKYASTQQNLGSYSSVRKFATGGIVTGATRAIVGESGTEAVIPLTDGTLGSLSKMIVGEMARPQVAQVTSSISSSFSGSDSSVAEQNALLREEVQLLRQIAGKEFTVSSSDVFNATRQESNNYYNRTGNSPFLF